MSLRVTGNLNDLVDEAYARGIVTVRLVSSNTARTNDVIMQSSISIQADENGDIDQTLETPDEPSESFVTRWTLPDGQSFSAEIATGADTTLSTLIGNRL